MQDLLHRGWLLRSFGVVGTNLILSGGNAVVIAIAGGRLRGGRRKKAILWGAADVFAVIITLLLAIPFLQKVRAGGSVPGAIRKSIAADAVMSLDNVIALVGVSGGDL